MSTTSITSGTYFIGKTLIIGSTGTSNTDYARVVEFNNNTTNTYLGVMFSATNKQPWFTFRPLGQMYSEPIMPWISYINVYYIYVFSFVSDIQVKYNIYEYNGASTIISKGTIGTYTAASAFLQNLTQFWLGRNVWNNDFYSGTYSKVALYNGDLLALTEANILSTLLTLVTSAQTNIINNSTTYTFRPVGSNFLGVVVNILNFNTTTGSNVTTSAITLIGTSSSSGGYLNITGSYIEVSSAPTSVTASAGNAQAVIIWTAPANNGGSAITSYTVTSSPEGRTATTANGSTTTATVTGLTNGTAYTFTVVATNAVGNSSASAASSSVTPIAPIAPILMHNFNSTNKSFIMYAHTLSSISGDDLTLKPNVGKNLILEVSGNNSVLIKKGTNVFDLSNLVLGQTASNTQLLDASLANVDISANLNPLVVNSASIGLATKNWNSAFISNIYCETLRTYRSDNILTLNSTTLMISGELFTSGNFNPLNNNGSSLGVVTRNWGNAYIRDVSANSIEVSGNIFPRDISSNLGSSLRRWDTLFADDISINNINGQLYRETTSNLSVSGGLIPINNNILRLGDVSRNWSNAYIRDLSVSSIDVSTNLNPLLANSSSLGLISKIWGNAYIRDMSVSSIDVSASLTPLIANGSILGLSTRPWNNAYIRDLSVGSIDVSSNSITPLLANGSSLGLIGRTWNNAYIRDMSVSSIDVSSNLNPLLVNSGSLGLPTRPWTNAYICDMSVGSIDLSVNLNPLNANSSSLGLITRPWGNAYIRDLSISSIDVSLNLTPLITNRSSLGLPSKIWGNAYIRDMSVSSIDISGNITPLIPNNSNLGSSLNRWNRLFTNDLSINNINGQPYTSGGGSSINLSSISGNIIPSTTNTFNLGSRTNYWNNAYIRNVITSARAYQGISGDISGSNFGDISWSAVNGYYGLAKDAYPSLNPLSNGDLAVRTWTARTAPSSDFNGVCWSPELRLFVAIASQGSTRVITSSNGINWDSVTNYVEPIGMRAICWSPERRMFLGVGYQGGFAPEGGRYAFLRSTDGINWNAYGWDAISIWSSICWSPELSLFVTVADGGNYSTAYSFNGLNWTLGDPQVYKFWTSVCWSAELRIFIAVSRVMDGSSSIMYSSNGKNWNIINVNTDSWYSVCWSPQLSLFVAVASYSTNGVMTSSNGIDWTIRRAAEINNWHSVCWSPQLKLFVAVAINGTNSVMTSNDGINWTSRPAPTTIAGRSICWSPELGIFAVVSAYTTTKVMTSSLKGRPPTSYNIFDSSFNRINEVGRWDFSNITVTTMRAGGSNVVSDDRLKHNEVVITNGLTIIDRLVPRFYQKTFDMLDASYNGDLSGHSWNYEAGLIAQEVLQISDLSYVVSGGDYYEKIIKYYDTSANYYDTSANYEISYNLVTQKYSLNYNSIFVYGLAAIKELHAKVKIIETNSLDEQLNSLVTRLEALEQNIS